VVFALRGRCPRPLDERAGDTQFTQNVGIEVAVAPGIRLIAVPFPGPLRAMNAYLIEGSSGWALVDTGLHTEEGEQALRAGVRSAGIDLTDVKRVFVTHVHPDHIGMAGMVKTSGAEVLMHAPEAEHARRLWAGPALVDETHAWFARHGMPHDVDDAMRDTWLRLQRRVDPIPEMTEVADGAVLDMGGRSMRVRWTPGHTDHHAVLVDEANATLIAGDHVLPKITSNISLYSWSRRDPLGDFLSSLRALAELPIRRVLPAHGEPFDDLRGRVQELLDHHDQRLVAVLDALGNAERDAYAVCRVLFPVLRSAYEERFALAETLAHLRYLELRDRVAMIDTSPVRWKATA
jgi:glyoxylase-like metal-dependent hydrolase (beta-lactamase superfamily II)